MKKLLLKFKEALLSVLPITAIVLVLALAIPPKLPSDQIWSFVFGAFLVMIGMALFTLGADVAMVQIGTRIGSSLTQSRKLPIIVILCFVLGLIITIAEPDLWVLADQMSGVVNNYLLIIVVGVGVGIFLVLALLRIVFQVPLRWLLIIFYAIVFVVAIFVPKELLPVSFDSGGVTTGPMTVPFIMALGVGIAATTGKNNSENSFGLVALCSIGPILSVLIMGLFVDTSTIDSGSFTSTSIYEGGIVGKFFVAMPAELFKVAIALLPITIFFLIYNFTKLKLPAKVVTRILFGMIYVYVGLVLFLTGASVGFSPVGKALGEKLVSQGLGWWLLPIGALIGFFIVAAEPAVHVLNEQVEEISNGVINGKSMMLSLMCGVALSITLSMIRVITGISIWWFIVPGYAISLVLSFFVPGIFTAVAFDSGGVVSGPMTATFLLPFAIGACTATSGGNVLTDAFGVVAMVAMTPLLTIQLLGLATVVKTRSKQRRKASTAERDEVMDFNIERSQEESKSSNEKARRLPKSKLGLIIGKGNSKDSPTPKQPKKGD